MRRSKASSSGVLGSRTVDSLLSEILFPHQCPSQERHARKPKRYKSAHRIVLPGISIEPTLGRVHGAGCRIRTDRRLSCHRLNAREDA